MKLALGTVQFGMNYGITNKGGQVSLGDVEKILRLAETAGIDTLDTAICYGDAESRIGRILGGANAFNIVTKLPPGMASANVQQAVEQSLVRLRRGSLEGVLVHSAGDLSNASGRQLFTAMEAVKEQGYCKKIGASIYQYEDFRRISERFAIDLFQVPLSVLDQRFLHQRVLEPAHRKCLTLHGRSLFLQGVLITPLHKLPCYFHRYAKYLQPLNDVARRFCVTPMVVALAVAYLSPGIERVVLGCCSEQQLRQQLESYELAKSIAPQLDLAALHCDNEALLLPMNWPEAC